MLENTNLNIVLNHMYNEEPYENKQRIRKFKDDNVSLIRYTPNITIIKGEMNDNQAHMLFECAKLILNGSQLKFSKVIPATRYPTDNDNKNERTKGNEQEGIGRKAYRKNRRKESRKSSERVYRDR